MPIFAGAHSELKVTLFLMSSLPQAWLLSVRPSGPCARVWEPDTANWAGAGADVVCNWAQASCQGRGVLPPFRLLHSAPQRRRPKKLRSSVIGSLTASFRSHPSPSSRFFSRSWALSLPASVLPLDQPEPQKIAAFRPLPVAALI